MHPLASRKSHCHTNFLRWEIALLESSWQHFCYKVRQCLTGWPTWIAIGNPPKWGFWPCLKWYGLNSQFFPHNTWELDGLTYRIAISYQLGIMIGFLSNWILRTKKHDEQYNSTELSSQFAINNVLKLYTIKMKTWFLPLDSTPLGACVHVDKSCAPSGQHPVSAWVGRRTWEPNCVFLQGQNGGQHIN